MGEPLITVPFSDAECEALNGWQGRSDVHPYTCPADGTRDSVKHGDSRILHADPDGWWCPFHSCGYHQTWAHRFMAEAPVSGRGGSSPEAESGSG